jgi:hypothetical protein
MYLTLEQIADLTGWSEPTILAALQSSHATPTPVCGEDHWKVPTALLRRAMEPQESANVQYDAEKDRYVVKLAGRCSSNVEGRKVRAIVSELPRLTTLVQLDPLPFYVGDECETDDLLMVLCLDDVHIGDDDEEAERARITRLVDAHLTTCLRMGGVGRIQLALGDFIHIDTMERTTTRGTQLHPTSSARGVWDRAVSIAIDIVKRCSAVAPVTWLAKHGNHDALLSHALMTVGEAYFAGDDRVTVELDHRSVTAFVWGDCLVAHHHGHSRGLKELPQQIARDFARQWGQTSKRYCFVGHRHHSEIRQKDGVGLMTIQVQCPAPSTEYEEALGLSSLRGVESFLLHKQRGKIAHFTEPV